MITIHQEKETDFTKNGYGSLDDNIVNPEVYWEMNSEFKFSFEYPLFGSNEEIISHLKNRNLVRVPVPYMDDQFFRIYRTKEVLGYVRVEARHLFYDLIDNLIEDTNIVGKNGLGALTQLLNATQYTHKFKAFSDIDSTANMRIVRYNPVKALLDDSEDNTYVNRWGGELYRDNYNIHMRKRIGTSRGIKIEHKKDLLGYEATIDESTIATRIMAKGFDGLLLPEKYVDSPLLDPDNPKIRVVEYSDVMAAIGDYEDYEDAIPLSEAYEELRRLAREEFSIHHVDEPETVIHVDFITLENTKEYEEFSELQEIHQGDTVQVSVPEQGFEITSRLVAFTSDPLRKNHYTSTTLGNHVLEYTSSRTEIDVIRKEIKNTNELALIARQSANGKNSNFWGTADPNTLDLNAQIDDTYFQEDGDYFAIWEYVEVNGERYWRKGPNTDFGKEISNQIKDAIDEIAEAKQTADEAVEQINTAVANAGFTNLDETISSVQLRANTAFDTANDLIGEVSGYSQTVDGFNQTVNNYTNQVANFQSDVNGFSSTVTSYSAEVRDYATQVSTLTNEVSGFNSTVANIDGRVTSQKQTIDGMQSVVYDPETGLTSLNTQLSNLIQVAVTGTELSNALTITETSILAQTVRNGEVIAQINQEAGSTLIQNDRIYLAAETVAFSGEAIIPSAAIESLSADKINTGELNATNVRIVNLDVNSLSGNHMSFITGAFTASNGDISIDGRQIQINSIDYANMRINRNNVEFSRSDGIIVGGLVATHNPFRPGSPIGLSLVTARSGQDAGIGRYIGNGQHIPSLVANGTTGNMEAYNSITMDTGTSLQFRGGGWITSENQNIIIRNNTANAVRIDTGLPGAHSNATRASFSEYGNHFFQNLNMNDYRIVNASRIEGASIIESGWFRGRPNTSVSFGYNDNGNNLERFRLLGDGIRMYSSVNFNSYDLNHVGKLNYASDARLKNIIGDRVENDLATIMSIDYKNYYMNGQKQRGFIAQKLQLIDSHLVSEDENGMLGYDGQGYMHTIGHAVQQLAFREENTNKIASQALQLAEDISDLAISNKSEIELLKEENKKLEQRIEELESAA